MSDSYQTISEASEGLFKDKGSRFSAFAYPVESEEEIKTRIRALKKAHHAARHHCWAWSLGLSGDRFRVSDDGEPPSSAGRPILGQIRRLNLTDILIVVVRYFGGTLLGVSGLIRAYGEAAADALRHARIIEKKVEIFFCVEFDYPQMNAVMKLLKDKGLPLIARDFHMRCRVRTSAPESEAERLFPLLRELPGVTVEAIS